MEQDDQDKVWARRVCEAVGLVAVLTGVALVAAALAGPLGAAAVLAAAGVLLLVLGNRAGGER
ncbi:hypothetical protein OG401_21065 [Kitasatospora purpeofusca]|uniref:hypothetical protein n=1 Tax=Kitasatospora purpeofusca TaxID=67352 RepID=UPI00224D71E4|nr:hypothetical protein [Kitasatospora purpeofusca]MCX4686772.1 hypothetical protein [Kitasatospora purpeofusca]